jgi:ferritin-like protein
MSEYHEPVEELDGDARDAHRALISLQEEIEAVDWYHQRRLCCQDPELARVLEHNRNEEMEHAAMLLEWLRRKMPGWEERLKPMLFTTRALGPEADKNAEAPTRASTTNGRGLGVGSLKGAP